MPYRIILAALATVETEKAQIKTDEAAVETAKINLEFTSLVAPIDGIAGQAQLQVGALVTPASGTVTSISTLDPIKVYFTVSEPQYLAWRKRFPNRNQPRSRRQSPPPSTDPRRWIDLRARRQILLCGSPGRRRHRRDSHRRALSESGQHSETGRLREGSSNHPHAARCAAGTSARGVGVTGRLSDSRRRRRQQSNDSHREGRRCLRLGPNHRPTD
jgi:hypothetical protein